METLIDMQTAFIIIGLSLSVEFNQTKQTAKACTTYLDISAKLKINFLLCRIHCLPSVSRALAGRPSPHALRLGCTAFNVAPAIALAVESPWQHYIESSAFSYSDAESYSGAKISFLKFLVKPGWKLNYIYIFRLVVVVVVVDVTRPLLRDEGMTEEYGTPESRQLPWAWTRGHRESRKKASGTKSS